MRRLISAKCRRKFLSYADFSERGYTNRGRRRGGGTRGCVCGSGSVRRVRDVRTSAQVRDRLHATRTQVRASTLRPWHPSPARVAGHARRRCRRRPGCSSPGWPPGLSPTPARGVAAPLPGDAATPRLGTAMHRLDIMLIAGVTIGCEAGLDGAEIFLKICG